MATRRQCAKCPWKKSVNPHDIPNGYSVEKHRGLKETIAMACHETDMGRELPCVGWLLHQLGPGNNIALRLAAISGRVDANVQTVGPQHSRFEDTLPKPKQSTQWKVRS